nr:hypothetical protein [uncultured Rhodoferax sp.]
MKILASIPVERVQVSANTFTYRTEIHELTVILVMRYASTRRRELNRFHYQADVEDHPMLLQEAKHGRKHYRVNIQRHGMNDKWPLPNFGDKDVYEVQKENVE